MKRDKFEEWISDQIIHAKEESGPYKSSGYDYASACASALKEARKIYVGMRRQNKRARSKNREKG